MSWSETGNILPVIVPAAGKNVPCTRCANAAPRPWAATSTAVTIRPAVSCTSVITAAATATVQSARAIKRRNACLPQAGIRAREADLLMVPYFHVVFTMPAELNRLCLYEPKLAYSLLFKTAWGIIRDFGGNPRFLGAQMGMIAILHTWGQNLSPHPHLHCIVPGGGIARSGKWKPAKSKGKPGCRKARYLFPVKAMSQVFRARFVAGLRKSLGKEQSVSFYQSLFKHHWVVYCKRPFLGPSQVVEYLGRYTHKIAISNRRIISLENGNVRFMVKDYRHGGKKSVLGLTDAEFIRRFALHILPRGFTRIRHYGILSGYYKRTMIPQLQKELGMPKLAETEPLMHRKCPMCKKGNLVAVATFTARGPPDNWREQINDQINRTI